jgi:hypothetical protein
MILFWFLKFRKKELSVMPLLFLTYACIAYGCALAIVLPPHHEFHKSDDWILSFLIGEISVLLAAVSQSIVKPRLKLPRYFLLIGGVLAICIVVFDMVYALFGSWTPRDPRDPPWYSQIEK